MFQLPPLPYKYDALAPYLSEGTLRFHHDGHHARYVRNVNAIVRGTDLEGATLRQVISAAVRERNLALYNNAAQAWNHTFLWHSMTPRGGGCPRGELATAVRQSLGSCDGLRRAIRNAAKSVFGSGWVWVVWDPRTRRVSTMGTPNADQPPAPLVPLLVMDVWEHAYYLDHPDAKAAYVDAFIDHLANWHFAEGVARSGLPPELR